MSFEELCKRYEQAKKNGLKGLNTYKVFYKEDGITYHCFIEAQTSKEARERATTEQYVKPETIIRIVKDC